MDLEYIYTVDSFHTDTHLWTSIVLVVISVFILLPILLYHSNKYFLHRNHIILKKRYANITMFESILLCIKLFVVPLGFYFFFDASNINIIWLIIWNFSHFLAISLYWCWFFRFFLLMYDIKWTLAIANNQWQQIINPHYKDLKLNWYLRKKKTFGQQSYIQYRIIIPIIIISTIIIWSREIIYVLYNENKSSSKLNILLITFIGLQIVVTISPLISLFIIRCKLPNSYHDNFYIISELQKIFICVFIDEVIFLVVSFFFIFEPRQDINDNMISIIAATEILLIDLFQWIAVLIATQWVNAKILPIIKYKRYEIRKSSTTHYQPLIISQNDEILSLFTNDYDSGHYIQKKIKLMNVLNRKKPFEIFMQHLQNELSLEICVALVELLQFRECIAVYINYHNIKFEELSRSKTKSVLNYIHFPTDIPLSEIVFNIDIYDIHDKHTKNGKYNNNDDERSNSDEYYDDDDDDDDTNSSDESKNNSMGNSTILLNNIDDHIVTIQKNNGVLNCKEKYLQFTRIKFINTYKNIAEKLYVKYIIHGSEYDIGIDELIRNNIGNMLSSNLNLFDLMHIFDLACIEIYGLLKKSFKRFKATPQWKKMKQCVSIQ